MSTESLFEQATSLGSLLRATRRASLGKRGRAEVASFLMDAEWECLELEGRLRMEPDDPLAWRPAPGRARWIRDPKPRRIVVIPFPDRVVHHALCRVAEPFFERYAVSRSYASRVGKGQVRAIEAARRIVRGHTHVLKADVLAFFASIPHDRLIALIRRLLPDPRLLEIFTRIIHDYQASPGRGLPIGSLCSQSFANLYLGRLDHHLMDQLGVRAYVRYMDDMLVGGDREGLRAIREEMRRFLDEKLGLALNPKVTRILPASVGVPFLGLRVGPRGVRLLRSTVDRFRQRLAWIDEALREGRIDQEEAATRASSVFAHVERFQSPAERLAILERLGSYQGWRLTSESDTDPEGRKPCGLQPGQPGRLLEQRPRQGAGRESEQERPRERQEQPGAASLQLGAAVHPGDPWVLPNRSPASSLRRALGPPQTRASRRPGLRPVCRD